MSGNFTWPVVVFEISRAELRLSAFSLVYSFPLESISALRKYPGIFSKGIQIKHQAIGAPEFIVFWTFQRNAVINSLLHHGYSVE